MPPQNCVAEPQQRCVKGSALKAHKLQQRRVERRSVAESAQVAGRKLRHHSAAWSGLLTPAQPGAQSTHGAQQSKGA
jgi:hypothetical protein